MAGGLSRIVGGQAYLRLFAVHSDECLVDEELGTTAHRGGPDQRKPISAQISAADKYLEVVAIAQFHRNIDAVRDYGDPLAMHQAAGHLGCRGAGAYRNCLAVCD